MSIPFPAAGSARRRTGVALTVLLLVLAAKAAQGPTELKPGFNLFTKQQDIELGQEAAAEVRKKATIVNDPVLTEYVNTIGRRLAREHEAKDSGFNFTFEVVADPAINAFALPGGPMFINTGLLKAVDNEAELAGVMGHEMSHVILRHGTNQASKADLIQIPLALAGKLTDSDTLMGQLTQLGIGLSADSVLLKFSRTDESQADLMGSHVMAEAGYDPIQMARFFNKLKSTDTADAIEFISDHPSPGNRAHAIALESMRLPRQNYGYQTGQFEKMKKEVVTIHEPAPKKEQPQE